jgi:Tfp pilus assembly protein PilP
MRANVRTTIFGLIAAMTFAGAAMAQTPSPAASPAPAPGGAGQTPASAQPPRPPEAYVYSSEGRRDPFLNLLGTGAEPEATVKRGTGPSGMMVAEISVRGILHGREGLIAMVQGPDNKTYIVHQGDKFLDGRIKTITPQGLIIIQEVNDPLSLVKEREIRKLLRSLEDAKG